MSDEIRADLLRRRRDELQRRDDVVSYVRRVAQGRADLVRNELVQRTSGTRPADLQAGLRDVLADRLLAGGDRPPRPAEEFSADPLSDELDALCAANGFGQLDTLDAAGLQGLLDALDGFEQRVSAERRDVFTALDAVIEELVELLRLENVSGEETGER